MWLRPWSAADAARAWKGEQIAPHRRWGCEVERSCVVQPACRDWSRTQKVHGWWLLLLLLLLLSDVLPVRLLLLAEHRAGCGGLRLPRSLLGVAGGLLRPGGGGGGVLADIHLGSLCGQRAREQRPVKDVVMAI